MATAVLRRPRRAGDVVDTEDDLQPLVATIFEDATRAVELVAVTMAGAEFDVEKMRERARQGWVTVTELADTLARDHGLSFRRRIASPRVVTERLARPEASIGDIVAHESAAQTGRAVELDEATVARILSPEHFIAIRRTLGGPAPRADVPGARRQPRAPCRRRGDGRPAPGSAGSGGDCIAERGTRHRHLVQPPIQTP